MTTIARTGNHEGVGQVGRADETSLAQDAAAPKKAPDAAVGHAKVDGTQDLSVERRLAARLGRPLMLTSEKGPFKRIESGRIRMADVGALGAALGAVGALYSTNSVPVMYELMLHLSLNATGATARPLDAHILAALCQPPASAAPKQAIVITDGTPAPDSAEKALTALKANDGKVS